MLGAGLVPTARRREVRRLPEPRTGSPAERAEDYERLIEREGAQGNLAAALSRLLDAARVETMVELGAGTGNNWWVVRLDFAEGEGKDRVCHGTKWDPLGSHEPRQEYAYGLAYWQIR